MALGILGHKLGMTQIFDEKGQCLPVTVIAAGPCVVAQIKTREKDGYSAIQIGYGTVRAKALSGGRKGHLALVGRFVRHLREFRLDDVSDFKVGQEIKADVFKTGQIVDVVGCSIGKGFQGMQRRHHAGRGPMAHGSKFHRHPGSIGAGTTPSRVYKGAKMPGRMGNERVTVRKLTVVRVDVENHLLLIGGAVPGVEGGLLVVTPAKWVGGPRAGPSHHGDLVRR